MLWIAGLFFLALRKLAKKINTKALWFLPFALLALGVFALAFAPLPFGMGTLAGLAGWCAGWALGLVGSWFGVSASAIASILLLALLLFAGVDLFKDHKPDGMAKTAVFALPVLTVVATGPIAAQVLQALHLISNLGPQIVNNFT